MSSNEEALHDFCPEVVNMFGSKVDMMREIWIWRSMYLSQSLHSTLLDKKTGVIYRDFMFTPSSIMTARTPPELLHDLMYRND